MECALCGRDVERLNKAEVEGTVIEVCDRCVRFGRVIEEPVYRTIKRKIEFKALREEAELIPRYGQAVKEARQAKGLRRDEFAKKINEKESVIKRIEMQQMEPDERLVKKIESFLGIKLMEKYEEKLRTMKRKKSELTVGDVAEAE